jgi:acetyl esterase/lipase
VAAEHPRRRRRIALILLALLLLAAALVVWKPSRVTMQTAVLLPSLVGAGPQPLKLFSAEPVRETLRYRSSRAAGDRADLWLPADASSQHRVGGLVLVLGVNNVGRAYPAVVRFADAMSRSGVAVLVPDSATLLAGGLTPAETDGVVDAFRLLAKRPEVDATRVGLTGLSVGGSLALLAAGDPRIASEVRWVNAFGAYADAREYLADVATHSFTEGGALEAWRPSQLTLEVFARLMLGLVADATDRQALQRAYQSVVVGGALPAPDPRLAATLSTGEGRAVYALLTSGTLERAREVLDRLPVSIQSLLSALSPVRHLQAIRADVFLMADTADPYIPFVQSRELASGLTSTGRLARATEFRLFNHVEPTGIDLVGAAPELWKLLWHVQAVLMETL